LSPTVPVSTKEIVVYPLISISCILLHIGVPLSEVLSIEYILKKSKAVSTCLIVILKELSIFSSGEPPLSLKEIYYNGVVCAILVS